MSPILSFFLDNPPDSLLFTQRQNSIYVKEFQKTSSLQKSNTTWYNKIHILYLSNYETLSVSELLKQSRNKRMRVFNLNKYETAYFPHSKSIILNTIEE